MIIDSFNRSFISMSLTNIRYNKLMQIIGIIYMFVPA